MKVLLTVKTYPEESTKYGETVCTAGILEDGSWARIYPLMMRSQQDYKDTFRKYSWVDIDLVARPSTLDFRPGTFQPSDVDHINVRQVMQLDTKHNWRARREALAQTPVYTNLATLRDDARQPKLVSLAVFKPTQIIDFVITPASKRESTINRQAARKQIGLFQDQSKRLEALPALPFRFKYRFVDDAGQESTMSILDWELGALYWNSLRDTDGDATAACDSVKKKYFDEFVGIRDIALFLGTTLRNHQAQRPNPFTTVGVFYPPHDRQASLFEAWN